MMDVFKNIFAAGISAITTVTLIHPIDFIKTRIQVSSKETQNYNSFRIISDTIKTILKEEGVLAFWKGINAAWLKEASYTSLRLGLYTPIKQAMGLKNDSPFIMKFTAGSLAGGIGSLISNPFEIIKTRMITFEGKDNVNFLSTVKNIYKSESASGFYKGLQANIIRACALNGTKTACYDEIKELIIKTNYIPSGILIHFCAAFTSGFFMATAVAPFDIIRTNIMNQTTRKYNGVIDCFVKIIKEKGIFGLYAGFIPIWARFAPSTCLQLVFFEQMKAILGIEKIYE
jgi:hypothetical protein